MDIMESGPLNYEATAVTIDLNFGNLKVRAVKGKESSLLPKLWPNQSLNYAHLPKSFNWLAKI